MFPKFLLWLPFLSAFVLDRYRVWVPEGWPEELWTPFSFLAIVSLCFGFWQWGTGHRRSAWLLPCDDECEVVVVEGGRSWLIDLVGHCLLVFKMPRSLVPRRLPDKLHIVSCGHGDGDYLEVESFPAVDPRGADTKAVTMAGHS